MKTLNVCLAAMAAASAALAFPEEAEVTISQDARTREVTIAYELSEAAIVTVDLYTNGVRLAQADYQTAMGDGLAFGRKVEAGQRTISWYPYRESWNASRLLPISARVKLWATNNPPDYVVCNLANVGDVTYYESADAIPGGVTDSTYKTTHLVLRRVHAAGVRWEMGSPVGESGRDSSREALHAVVLTNDYYLGIYELTQKQVAMVTGERPSSSYGGDDWWEYPVESSGVYYELLRGKKTDGIIWPKTGHQVSDTSLLAKFRERTGLQLDLPVEAQWEFAARAGSLTGLYNGFNITNENFDARYEPLGWSSVNRGGGKTTFPVGLKQANDWGFYDMLGNVSEYCLDWWAFNPGDVDYNVGLVGDDYATCNRRGGSSANDYKLNTNRVNYRDASGISAGRVDGGCRLALTLCY